MQQEWDPEEGVLETELGNGWIVATGLEMQDGRRVVAELRIFPVPLPFVTGTTRKGRHPGERPVDAPVPAGGITGRLLRTVRLGASAQPVTADYRRRIKRNFGADALGRLDAHTGRPARKSRKKRPRTRRAGDGFYARLARDYVELSKRGVRRITEGHVMARDHNGGIRNLCE